MTIGQPDRATHSRQRNLQLHHQTLGRANNGHSGVDVAGQKLIIRSTRDTDQVLAALTHHDERHAAGGRKATRDVTRVDPLAAQPFQRRIAKRVATDVGDERHMRPGTHRGHRLIRAFAACNDFKTPACDRFARMRQLGHTNHQVRVRAADDDDGRFHDPY